ncbi:hypothetical protein ARMSODRAFT_983054 [Armillaria solidipes]|uniref:Uncharacterized protein n=1 Tax=Armillaria solidipes TaxID=1076256 RepID=A0A2H3B8K8_9AGAR|nr:hypothetical protein ARMSODRAFT_983054 [Armillaria solidipes]
MPITSPKFREFTRRNFGKTSLSLDVQEEFKLEIGLSWYQLETRKGAGKRRADSRRRALDDEASFLHHFTAADDGRSTVEFRVRVCRVARLSSWSFAGRPGSFFEGDIIIVVRKLAQSGRELIPFLMEKNRRTVERSLSTHKCRDRKLSLVLPSLQRKCTHLVAAHGGPGNQGSASGRDRFDWLLWSGALGNRVRPSRMMYRRLAVGVADTEACGKALEAFHKRMELWSKELIRRAENMDHLYPIYVPTVVINGRAETVQDFVVETL